ncbi:flavin-containing monooxygenase [Nocardia brasiliensis]|uniref:flavin-containing monooxygenase n=1 Tax=Nocardia brasiliensis TaxID=37326 RepID=UPI0033C0ECBD
MTAPDFTVAVVGAGPSGIVTGIKLKQAGIQDFTILERADDVGGSWHSNTYPAICADSPGLAYQYSFLKNRNWTRFFPKGSEVRDYHVRAARQYGLYPHLQFGKHVVAQKWDAGQRCWNLRLADGETITARFLITAVGVFVDPVTEPDIAGIDEFEGVVQRTASWQHAHRHEGKRVAVIGTGASAVQIVPALAPDAAVVDVYQRTPVWCLPKPDFDLTSGVARVLRSRRLVGVLHGIGLAFFDLMLRLAAVLPKPVARFLLVGFDLSARAAYSLVLLKAVRDPAVRQLLRPRFGLVVKRPVLSNSFLQTFNRANTNLITEPIERLTRTGIRTTAGVDRTYDMIVLATGFVVFIDPRAYPPGTIVGRDDADLGTLFATRGMQAYEGLSVPGFPNRWMIVGPYSWTGTGWHSAAELAADHTVRIIKETLRRGAEVAEVTQAAHDRYHRAVQRNGRNIELYYKEINGGTRTYYVNAQGEVAYIRPGSFLRAIWGGRYSPVNHYRYTGSQGA